jgi:DNA-binding transcriptional ArsR family regulator
MTESFSKDLDELADKAAEAARFLKALANENRLLILCILSQGERSVGELEELLQLRQSTLSQQLAVLREQRLVQTRRNGKSILYSLTSPEAQQLIGLLYELYCSDSEAPAKAKDKRLASSQR